MAETKKEVLRVLLDILHDQDLIDNSTHDSANSLLHSVIDLPEFFWYPVCYQEEDEENECT